MEQPRQDDIGAVEDSLSKLEAEIKRVEKEIALVVKKLEPLEEKEEGEKLSEKEEKRLDGLRKEKEQLRKKEEQLRNEKEQLRKKEEQLRAERLLLLGAGRAEADGVVVPIVSAPSSVSVSTVENLCQNASILSFKVYVDVIQVMVSKDGADAHPTGTAIMEVLRLCDRRSSDGGPLLPQVNVGLFKESGGADKHECLYSGALCSTFAARCGSVGEQEARWLHRIPERSKGEVDVQLCVICGATTWLPVMVMEVGLREQKNKKHTQASAYAINVSSQLGLNDVLLLAELVIHPSDANEDLAWLTVTGCHVVAADRKLARVLLWNGPLTAQSCERLLQACDVVAKWNMQAHSPPWQCINVNVACSSSDVFKAFDYRGREVAKDARRKADLSVQFIPDCEAIVDCDDLVVISYPRLTGGHIPCTVGHFAHLIESISHLHADGVIHGDIRASNIIFGEQGSATLIDFDFSGYTTCTYPKGFNRDIEDGKRARGARPESKLEFQHDWFALDALMGMAQVPDTSLWNNARSLVSEGNLNGALVLLDSHYDIQLSFSLKSAMETKGTGSPPRNP